MYTISGDASAGKIWEKKTLGVTTDQFVKIKKCKAVTDDALVRVLSVG
ncbi:hypothetical protein AB0A60_34860 [Streptomyces sp. NPDC046275]